MADNIKYDITIMVVFAIIGIFIKLFFGKTITTDGSQGPASATMWGYGIVAMSILSIIFITFALASRMVKLEEGPLKFIKQLIKNSLPPLLLFAVLVWIIALNVTYFSRINEGKVANEYSVYSNISTVLIIVQLIILFKYLKDDLLLTRGGNINKTTIEKALESELASITYVLTIINLIFAGIMNIILEFYSTDG